MHAYIINDLYLPTNLLFRATIHLSIYLTIHLSINLQPCPGRFPSFPSTVAHCTHLRSRAPWLTSVAPRATAMTLPRRAGLGLEFRGNYFAQKAR